MGGGIPILTGAYPKYTYKIFNHPNSGQSLNHVCSPQVHLGIKIGMHPGSTVPTFPRVLYHFPGPKAFLETQQSTDESLGKQHNRMTRAPPTKVIQAVTTFNRQIVPKERKATIPVLDTGLFFSR